jgi:tRNA-dihydrouridine synthase B
MDNHERMRRLLDPARVCLAPMAGVSDSPFRRICRRMGTDYVVSEFLSADGLTRGTASSREMLAFTEEERPIGLQLFGADPEAMARAARQVESLEPDFIDLNFGCPVKKVVRRNGGSALMKEPDLLLEICRRVVEAVGLPVTAKIRTGWDESSPPTVEIARAIEDTGITALTLHGRSRAQGFSGRANWDVIASVKAALEIPVVGNGDVTSWEEFRAMGEMTGCDVVMLGRGAMGNPWIFAEIRARLAGRPWSAPSAGERLGLMLDHVRDQVAFEGERALVSMRRHLSQYVKGLPDSSGLRRSVVSSKRLAQIEDAVARYLGRAPVAV